jgi:hypothetical protein
MRTCDIVALTGVMAAACGGTVSATDAGVSDGSGGGVVDEGAGVGADAQAVADAADASTVADAGNSKTPDASPEVGPSPMPVRRSSTSS